MILVNMVVEYVIVINVVSHVARGTCKLNEHYNTKNNIILIAK